jgi:hypothetical protein
MGSVEAANYAFVTVPKENGRVWQLLKKCAGDLKERDINI